ncbi:MAG: MMPL family transporter, partial [Acidimicrobiia bacterium]|nr:MMPL family transporter [Acidimicrobiia bacterium]
RPTLVALVPIVLTLGTLLGFVAVAGIQLNMITAVASSIVIGVGIDYSIHFIAAIDYARPDGPGYVLRAIDRAGRPITANAMGIAVAMTALWLSPLRTHHHISLIMWVSMTVAAISALVVIPALLPRDGVEIPASAPSAAGSG